MKQCYFCQKELEIERDYSYKDHNGNTVRRVNYKSCMDCAKPNGLTEVISNFDEDGSNLYTHLIIDKSIRFPGTNFFNRGFGFYYAWNIRLNHKKNTTSIYTSTDSEIKTILELPGFPIKPENAVEKLKLYVLFS